MKPTTKQLVRDNNDLPLDLSQLRFTSSISKNQVPDDRYTQLVWDAIDYIQSKTDLSIIRGTYTCIWEREDIPVFQKPPFMRDGAIGFPGFHATINSFEYYADKEWKLTTDYDSSQRTEVGSLYLYPKDGYWSSYTGIERIRVIGTAGCDTQNNKMLGQFSKSISLVLRYYYYDEPASLKAAKELLNRWFSTGSLK